MVPPSPWKTVMIDEAMELTFCGSRARNSGLKPPMSASRSRAGWVRESGDESAWGQSCLRALPGSPVDFQIPIADEVGVPDFCGRRLVQRHRAVDGEVDAYPLVALDQVDLFDLADFYTCGADELTGTQTAGVAELRGIAVGPVEAHLTKDHDDDCGEQQLHCRDGSEPDDRSGDFHGLIVFSPY
jgi:hypothetical protein